MILNNITSIPRSIETDSLFTFADMKTKIQNHTQQVWQCFFSAKCAEHQLSRKFFLFCKIQLIADVISLVRGCFYFACNCDLSSRILICWSLSWNFHKCSTPPDQLKTKERLLLHLKNNLKQFKFSIFLLTLKRIWPRLFLILWDLSTKLFKP